MTVKEQKRDKALHEYFEARHDRMISPEESFEAGFEAAWNLKRDVIERLEDERDELKERLEAIRASDRTPFENQ